MAAAALASMSDRQKEIVNEATLANLERSRDSESIRAMARDVEMFGLAAFEEPPAEEDVG